MSNFTAKDAAGVTQSFKSTGSGTDVAPLIPEHAINDGGNSITVDATSLPLPTGASTAAKQPALGTAGTASTDVLTVQGIASMTALKTDGSAVTQPVSAASLPLPSGAATAAKQPALGTAGSASADVITVQGAASMTALKTDSSAVTQPVSAASGQIVDAAIATLGAKADAKSTSTDTTSVTLMQVAKQISASTQLSATAAKQPALGTAGTSSSDVLSMQGIASGTPLAVVGKSLVVSANFTRPADTNIYAVGDLVANNTTAGSVTPLSWAAGRVNDGYVTIRRARLKKSGTSVTNAQFRLHLFGATPTVTNGDNGVWLPTQSTYLGWIDITLDKVFSDASEGIGVPTVGSEIIAPCLSGATTIKGLLEARGAYTPVSGEVFTVELEVLQD